MNPALIDWWLSQQNGPNAYQDSMIGAPEQDFMQQYNVMPREDMERMGKVVVPGTGGMQEAPQMPPPSPYVDPRTDYGQPNEYDTVDGPYQGPLDQQGNPINQGTPSAGPLEKGSAAATQAVGERKRGRYEMDEMQQRRALGAALMAMAGNHGIQDEHTTGLESMVNGLNPAMNAYLQEAHNQEKMNVDAYKSDQDVRLKEAELQIKRDELNRKLTQSPYDAMTADQQVKAKNTLRDQKRQILRDKHAALDAFTKNVKGPRDERPSLIEAKKKELDAEYQEALDQIDAEAAGLGIKSLGLMPGSNAKPEVSKPQSTATTPGELPPSRLNQIKELLKTGKANAANGVSPQELTAFLAQIARK